MTNFNDKNVLIVDDDSIILRVTKKVLENIGFNEIKLANNARQGLKILSDENFKIDVFLLDLRMPDMDGIEMLRKISELKFNGNLIIFSGEDESILEMSQELAIARKIPVIGTLKKPVSKNNILNLLNEASKKAKPIYSVDLHETANASMLKNAIELESIEPWFQPLINVETKEIIGVEALARWPVGINNYIPPVTFIPLAEKHNLIEELTVLLIRKIILYWEKWINNGINLNISINISKTFINDINFPHKFESWFESNPSILKKITMEISETDISNNLIIPLDVLLRLNLKKIRLYLDDFGTGASNFTQLKALPFNEMKIDCKYVHFENDDKRSEAILTSSIDLAKKLNMKIVAEGVETREDFERIKDYGCNYAQGFFMAIPMHGDKIPDWINNWPNLQHEIFGN